MIHIHCCRHNHSYSHHSHYYCHGYCCCNCQLWDAVCSSNIDMCTVIPNSILQLWCNITIHSCKYGENAFDYNVRTNCNVFITVIVVSFVVFLFDFDCIYMNCFWFNRFYTPFHICCNSCHQWIILFHNWNDVFWFVLW